MHVALATPAQHPVVTLMGSNGQAVNLTEDRTLTRSVWPAGAVGQTFPRQLAVTNASILATGVLSMAAVPLLAGEVVTNISFVSGTTAAGVPLNQWFALYSSARALLGITLDDTTTAWAADTVKTRALTTPYSIPTTGLYYVAICVVATTVPTLRGATATAAVNGVAPISSGHAGGGFTTPASAPNPAAALTAVASTPYAWVS